MGGRRAAAAADNVEQAVAGKGLDLGCHLLRRFVILPELVRQAGVRIGTDEGVGNAGKLVDMRTHGVGAERAVEPDGERLGMAHGIPERRRRLA
ncbi:hypothetical protein D3C78_1651330 [compost metagenome]